MSVRKVDFEWGKGPIFAVYGPKFTKFGMHEGKWLQFPIPFSSRQHLVPIWRYLQ